jgi:hypothetical protein
MMANDQFGIRMLNATASGGWEWFSTWADGTPTTLRGNVVDHPRDPYFQLRGDAGECRIDGHGIAHLSGHEPRMYVWDRSAEETRKKWQNVEITFYGKRVLEKGRIASQGFIAGVRGEHQDAGSNYLLGRNYYGRILYDRRVNIIKEIGHPYYSSNRPSELTRLDWSTPDGEPPRNYWIGYKFVVRNYDSNTKVQLDLYYDLAEGADGGRWQDLLTVKDEGGWEVVDTDHNRRADDILLGPGSSALIRNDQILEAQYRHFSVREINPLV